MPQDQRTYLKKNCLVNTYISGASRGAFQQPVNNNIHGSVVEGDLARPISAVHNDFWDIKSVVPSVNRLHNTSISLLLSTSVWVLLSPPIEHRENTC